MDPVGSGKFGHGMKAAVGEVEAVDQKPFGHGPEKGGALYAWQRQSRGLGV
jgi:hypothetical protein